MSSTTAVTAFAPASVGNVGVGFDVLGHALDGVGDTVRLQVADGPGIRLGAVTGTVDTLPSDPASNTALKPLMSLCRDYAIDEGVIVSVDKGIPMGSGMGGSAASAVASVVAANFLWQLDLNPEQQLAYAALGETVASGAGHLDNLAPSLIGGLVLCEEGDPAHLTRLPVPAGLRCVLVHPALRIHTRDARAMLDATVPLARHVEHAQHLAGFVAGCMRGDVEQIGRCLRDVVIEPQRQSLITGFRAVKTAAMAAGALGASISGSGPSVFAWCHQDAAAEVARVMTTAFADAGVKSEHWVSAIDAPGARIVAPAAGASSA
ncbi:MAG: homoserine kinase [Gammaproteobacteria bacterium]|jgi:homoserine kinase